MSNRAAALKKVCADFDDQTKTATEALIDEIVFLEEKLIELKQYPFLSVNPENPQQQRATAAGKQYKEFLQQYNNCIKILLAALGKIESADDSPLRQYLKNRL